MADASDLGSDAEKRGGSSPPLRTCDHVWARMLGARRRFRCTKCSAIGIVSKRPSPYGIAGEKENVDIKVAECSVCGQPATVSSDARKWRCEAHRPRA